MDSEFPEATAPRKLVPTVWSYSSLSNFERCPRRFYEVQEAKTVKDLESDAIQLGHEAHRLMQAYVDTGKSVPAGLSYLAWIADQVRSDAILVRTEEKLALDDELNPVQWKSYEACWRGVGDLISLRPDAIWVVDWKSGKLVDDDLQLRLLALALLQTYPEYDRVFGLFAYTSRRLQSVMVERATAMDVVDAVNPRLLRLRVARAENNWPEQPGRHCRWCPVTSCRFNELEQARELVS